MGTYIQLMINKTCIDWGKNNHFLKHSWLFPENSKKKIQYEYADNIIENKEGYSSNLAKAKFRLDNLGYSFAETKAKYDHQLSIWNRVNNLTLPFEYLLDVIIGIDLNIVSDNYIFNLEGHPNGFRGYLYSIIEHDDKFQEMNISDRIEEYDGYYSLEDFLIEVLDVYIVLRLLCESNKNMKYNLEWQYTDIVESGWASYEDIEEFDKKEFIINHNRLFGKLQMYAIEENDKYYHEKEFDEWLVNNGIAKNKNYMRLLKDGRTQQVYRTLPTYIRNVIHHPENINNNFSDKELNSSITQMLKILDMNI